MVDIRPQQRIEDKTRAHLLLGQNAEAYFQNHKSASLGTIASFLGGVKRDAVVDLIVDVLQWGIYDKKGRWVSTYTADLLGYVQASRKEPFVTLNGYLTLLRFRVFV